MLVFDTDFSCEEPYAVVPLVRICAGGGQRWLSLPRHDFLGTTSRRRDLSKICPRSRLAYFQV